MTAQWREFEKLIARIEQAMAPLDAAVRSPDRIPDKVTGELREVDASIRYKVGTCPILITIECRDRSSIEDVRWIEQLAEKKRSIGASMTLAVSSSGFSDPAMKKASAVDIEIRTLSDMAAEDFRQWLAVQHVVLDVREWSLSELALELYDAPEDAELILALQESFRERGHLAPIFIRNLDGKRFHVENVLIEWCKRHGTFFPDDLPSDGTRIRRNLHQPVDAIFSMLKQRKGTSTFASFTLACGCHIRRRWFLFQGSRNILIHLRPWYKRLNGTCGARSSCPCTETWNRAKRK